MNEPKPITPTAKTSMLESAAEAALGGHDLAAFEAVDNDYQARCRACDKTVWVGWQGLVYSILGDVCEG